MQINEATSEGFNSVGDLREGRLDLKPLLTGHDGSLTNYILNVSRTGGGGFGTPRHRHNFDQIRYPIEGGFSYAKDKTIPEGWVGYFPEGVYYGPQERPEGLFMMVCQFGGASGNGYISKDQREAAMAALKEKGQFDKGVFSFTDTDGRLKHQDAFEACFEHAGGRKLKYPNPRYQEVIVMNPENFDWVQEPSSGVFTKSLGCFTERSIRVGFTRITSGAAFGAGAQKSDELLFLTKGKVSISGRSYGPHSAFGFSSMEGPIPITADTESEFLRITLPIFNL
jgi:hypothetical protein